GRVFLGSNTDHVLHEGQTTMFVYKQPQKSMNEKRAVVPIDYSPVSNEVIRKADQWALDHDVELFFLYVQETPEMMNVSAVGGGYYSTSSDYESRLRHSTKQVEELEQQLRQRVRENHVKSPNQIRIDFGKPYFKILEICKGLMASTLIMASHSHTMAGRLIMGSNTDYLLHHAHCSMYILKNYELDNH
ncbi:MAG: universal stress protein, partial [SAR324 cluster bacterium]|nr:universal stress protein [SAR324 cluster bacterium]